MLGLLIVGLAGLLVVVVSTPVVLWGLCMETLRERAAVATATPSVRPLPSRRSTGGKVIPLRHTA